MTLNSVLTHAEVSDTAVSQDHDEFGLVCPPLLFPSWIQLLHSNDKMHKDQSILLYVEHNIHLICKLI